MYEEKNKQWLTDEDRSQTDCTSAACVHYCATRNIKCITVKLNRVKLNPAMREFILLQALLRVFMRSFCSEFV